MWALALTIVAVIVVSWEVMLRTADLGPEYQDNRSLWAEVRHGLNRHGRESIALLGASRVQRGVDVDTLSSAFGRPVFQLAVEGASALAVLENLAVDPRFHGTVVYSVAPAFTFNRYQRRVDYGRQRQWLDYYTGQSYSRQLEQSLTLWLQGQLAFRSPDAKLTRVVPALVTSGSLPERDHKTTLGNRVVLMDYSKMPIEANEVGMMQLYLENSAPYSTEAWQASLNYFSALVEILRAKGSDVIFVRLPSGEQVGALEAALFPPRIFWDQMESGINATFVHSRDYPELSGFVAIDGSHIESPRIVEFTERLAEVLRRNGLRAAGDP